MRVEKQFVFQSVIRNPHSAILLTLPRRRLYPRGREERLRRMAVSGTGQEDHTHGHRHHRTARSQRRLAFVLVLITLYMFAEAAGGWLSNSLALLADAGHM